MIDPSCFMFWYTSHFVFAEENDSAYITVVGFKSCWDAEWPRSLIFWFSLEHLTFLNLSDHWVMRSRNYKIYYLVSVKIIIMTLQWNVRLNEHACCFCIVADKGDLECWMLIVWKANELDWHTLQRCKSFCLLWMMSSCQFCCLESKKNNYNNTCILWFGDEGSQCKIIAQPLGILQYELWANSCRSTVSTVVISVSVYTAIKQWIWGAFAFQ